MKNEINRIAESTEFNGNKLLNGEGKSDLSFQVGSFAGEENQITFNASDRDVRAGGLGIGGSSVESRDDAADSLADVDQAIESLNGFRAELGAVQNRLHSASRNLGVTVENLASAKSRVADTDVAKETAELMKNNILQSASVSVLAQANSKPASALKLIG